MIRLVQRFTIKACLQPPPLHIRRPTTMLIKSPCSAHPSMELHLHQPPRVVDHAKASRAVEQGETARSRQPRGGLHPMGPC